MLQTQGFPVPGIFLCKSPGFLRICEQKGNGISGEIGHTSSPMNSKYGKVLKRLYCNPTWFSIFGFLHVIYKEAVQKGYFDSKQHRENWGLNFRGKECRMIVDSLYMGA